MGYYLLVLLSAALFSVSFVFTKYFQSKYGTGVFAGIVFRGVVSLCLLILFLGLNKFRLRITGFSAIMALCSAIVQVSMFVVSTKTLENTNLALYSLFSMLGGMLLPFFYGLCIGESLTVPKIIGIVLIISSMFVALNKSGGRRVRKMDIFYFSAIFVLNGMNGVFADMHGKTSLQTVNVYEFIVLINLFCIMICIVACGAAKIFGPKTKSVAALEGNSFTEAAEPRQETVESRKEEIESQKKEVDVRQVVGGRLHRRTLALVAIFVGMALGYALTNGSGNYIVIELAPYIDASFKYPLVTGGCILFSTLFGIFFKEKITILKIISFLLVLGGTVLMLF